MKYFKLHRWDLIKQYRSEKQEEKAALLKIMHRAKQIIIRVHSYLMLKHIFARFNALRDAKRIYKKKKESALKIQGIYGKFMERLCYMYERRTLHHLEKDVIRRMYTPRNDLLERKDR